MGSSRVAVLVPRREDGGERDALWAWCRARWKRDLPNAQIVEGHHTDGKFNRSAAINDAAEMAGEWDTAVIIDSDVFLEEGQARLAVLASQKLGQAVLPYTRRMLINKQGTDGMLSSPVSARPPTQRARPDPNRGHVSSVVVVPRAQWDQVGGFDPRFVGWGAEDDAFWAALKKAGKPRRVPGAVWHLHHAPSPERNHDNPDYRRNLGLMRRWQQWPLEQMAAELTTEPEPGSIAVVVLTNGKRPALMRQTLDSIDRQLQGRIARKLLLVDGTVRIGTIAGWEQARLRGGNYMRAMHEAFIFAGSLPEQYVFWVEDDFTFNRPVELDAMAEVMAARPELVQMSLIRQPWYQLERKAGGVREQRPDQFTDEGGWLSHRWYWTQNPMLCRTAILCEHAWPQTRSSEAAWGALVFQDPNRVGGVWGSMNEPPAVHHRGNVRAGTPSGY